MSDDEAPVMGPGRCRLKMHTTLLNNKTENALYVAAEITRKMKKENISRIPKNLRHPLNYVEKLYKLSKILDFRKN
jgi:hypothetical protein